MTQEDDLVSLCTFFFKLSYNIAPHTIILYKYLQFKVIIMKGTYIYNNIHMKRISIYINIVTSTAAVFLKLN
jgi:hypothetical protein